MEQTIFLERLITLFDRSTDAYRQYLHAGKTYEFAQQLKLHNGNALQLLKENRSSLPENWQEDIRSLITHYTEWSLKWEQLDAEKKFEPNDVFVFANNITFPKQAAQKLEDLYKKIKQPPGAPHGK